MRSRTGGSTLSGEVVARVAEQREAVLADDRTDYKGIIATPSGGRGFLIGIHQQFLVSGNFVYPLNVRVCQCLC